MTGFIQNELTRIKSKGLWREQKYFEAPQMPWTIIQGKKMLQFASNSYLGLASDPRLIHASIDAVDTYGTGSGGSRLTSGSYLIHRELEKAIAEFKGTEAALLFNTGYMANIGVISAIAGPGWTVFCDKLNHASIIDGIRLSGAELAVYRHANMKDLRAKACKRKGRPGMIVTDGVFSMDGDIAPLPELVEIAKEFDLLTMVDDAHATGVLGRNGAGAPEYYHLKDPIDIQMGTLSKALSSEGGFAAGTGDMIDYLRHKAKSYIYSTALAPQTAAVSLKALEIVQSEPERLQALLENASYFRYGLSQAGFQIPGGITPIIPIVIGPVTETLLLSQALYDEGIFIPAIRPPTVKEGSSRLRVSLMATHSREDLDFALDKISLSGKKLGLIP